MALEASTLGVKDNATVDNVTVVEEAERIAYIGQLQEQTKLIMLPTIVFLVCCAVVGLFGNTLALIVYFRKVRRTATQIFIMVIALFDLLTNVTAIPADIYDMFHNWDFDDAAMCRVRHFFTSSTALASGILFLALSVVRFQKVCRSFGRQVSVRQAKAVCVIISAFSSIVSVPYAILYGTETIPSPRADIFGSECGIDDRFTQTVWPAAYYSCILLLFLSCCIPLVVLYTLIGIVVWRHSKLYGVSALPSAQVKATSGGNSPSITSGAVSLPSNDSSSRGAAGASGEDSVEMTDLENAETGNVRQEVCRESPDNTRKEESDVSSGGRGMPKTTEMGKIMFSSERDGSGQLGQGKRRRHDGAVESVSDREATDSCSCQQNKAKQVSVPTVEKVLSCNQTPSGEIYIPGPSSTTLTKKEKKQSCDVSGDPNNKQNYAKNDPRGQTVEISTTTSPSKKRRQGGVIQILSRRDSQKKSPKLSTTSTTSTLGQATRRPGLGKTTMMLIIVSFIYIIGFLPHLCVVFFRFASPEKFAAMGTIEQIFYNLALRFFFLNSAANPVIYSLCDRNFRLDCLQVFQCKRKMR
ncbi:muscarinic acetylcholine receptor gar-3 [Aplysia californica]|uniref:Muscarinic acetylcholine receptor gar-3 n=1 Tax=Aplysia californica TaxID=6500 RepID=A0ABM0K4U1_APLCA|nr:muscarinic acetylcholine receptor gar-3 [Aplysia californica]